MGKTIKVIDKTTSKEFLKIESFRKNVRKTNPHKHKQYFEIVYLSEGAGEHTIDHQTYLIQPPLLFLIKQEQVHHWNITEPPKGFVILLKKEFFNHNKDLALKPLLTQLSNFTCISVKNINVIEQLFLLLKNEANALAVEGMLKALFVKILEETNKDRLINRTKTGEDLFQRYCDLLSEHEKLRNSVAFYANQLHTSPQNLNAVCKKKANSSAGEILSEYLIREAKRLLRYTDSSVAEIAYQLKFSDSSHFIKYFKKHTNCTPKTFRLI